MGRGKRPTGYAAGKLRGREEVNQSFINRGFVDRVDYALKHNLRFRVQDTINQEAAQAAIVLFDNMSLDDQWVTLQLIMRQVLDETPSGYIL